MIVDHFRTSHFVSVIVYGCDADRTKYRAVSFRCRHSTKAQQLLPFSPNYPTAYGHFAGENKLVSISWKRQLTTDRPKYFPLKSGSLLLRTILSEWVFSRLLCITWNVFNFFIFFLPFWRKFDEHYYRQQPAMLRVVRAKNLFMFYRYTTCKMQPQPNSIHDIHQSKWKVTTTKCKRISIRQRIMSL